MKKSIPLTVHKIIEPYLSKQGKVFEFVQSDKYLLFFKDKDEKSDFHFRIMDYKVQKNVQVLIEFKPAHANTVEGIQVWANEKEIEHFFVRWLEILEGYDIVRSVFDDPIIVSYTTEYYSEFKLVDDDAEVAPFNLDRILLLDQHLENIETRIESYNTGDNDQRLLEIKKDVIELRKNLTSKSKAWVIKKLATIWAKISKEGANLLKEFLAGGKKELIQKGVKYIIDTGIDIINQS